MTNFGSNLRIIEGVPPVKGILTRQGRVENYKLTDQEKESAIRAAKVLGLSVAGVDLIQSDRGPLVLEVNSSPGLEGIERASGIDVADKIIEYLEQQHVTRDKSKPIDI